MIAAAPIVAIPIRTAATAFLARPVSGALPRERASQTPPTDSERNNSSPAIIVRVEPGVTEAASVVFRRQHQGLLAAIAIPLRNLQSCVVDFRVRRDLQRGVQNHPTLLVGCRFWPRDVGIDNWGCD